MVEKTDKFMDINELCDKGYLQEVNRQFFHPLGLALVVAENEKGESRLYGILDGRDDPAGIWYEDESLTEKAAAIAKEFVDRAVARKAALNYVIQPCE